MTIRNVLLIGVDQMRADVAGPGKRVPALTPNLDRLHAESARFDRAYSPCPLCTPARASLFTGDHAFRHGMGTNCDMYHSLATELPDPSRLLHLRLLEEGYRCGFVGKWHVGTEKGPAAYGFDGMNLPGYGDIARSQGFRDYLVRNNLSYEVEPTLFFNPDRQTMGAGRWRGPVESTPAHYLTDLTIKMLSDYAEGGVPFFATVQYWDPHQPHLVSDEFHGITDRSRLVPWPNFDDGLKGKPARVRRERDDFYRLHPRSETEAVEYIGAYCDHLAMLDHEIGRLLDWLDAPGLRDDTLVVFTSDHGDMTGAHGGLIDKGLLYEEAIRVPLLFRGARIPPGPRTTLASNLDIMPTVLARLGIRHGPRHGMDLSPAFAQPNARLRDHLLIEFHGLRFLYSQRALLREDGSKLIFTPGDHDELYNIAVDPGEMSNLAGENAAAGTLVELQEALIVETARLDDPLRDCVAKFYGRWRTGSGQFDATTAPL